LGGQGGGSKKKGIPDPHLGGKRNQGKSRTIKARRDGVLQVKKKEKPHGFGFLKNGGGTEGRPPRGKKGIPGAQFKEGEGGEGDWAGTGGKGPAWGKKKRSLRARANSRKRLGGSGPNRQRKGTISGGEALSGGEKKPAERGGTTGSCAVKRGQNDRKKGEEKILWGRLGKLASPSSLSERLPLES